MNKTAIKNYAIWARNKLIADIIYKAGLMGITEKGVADALPQSTNEVQFFDIGTKDYATVRGKDISQRNAFVSAIREKEKGSDYKTAFQFVVEKVAYTWFNRLVAIRFMEVNDYLPSRVRVLSSENVNKAEPDMVTNPFDTDMEFNAAEQDYVMQLKDENRLDELFRWLFIKQCHKLHEVLPLLFSPEQLSSSQNDYMELLLTISFTDKDGVLWHLVHDIREQDFRIRTPEDDERQQIENIPEEDMPAGQVEIIGWMYQYYNTEPKDQVFANLKKNIKISKDNIPAATQLFTPDWIVRYMVENSLGRLWVEGHPNEDLKKNWKYYLEEAEQEPEVQKQLAEIRKEYAALRPEEIKVIDPCMGSGHILVYLFDVLMQIYESQGWTQREAAQSIVQNNLYGLDIDERAAQLAYFAVMMKARQYDRRFLDREIEPHVYEIQESNGVDSNLIEYFANGNKKLKADMTTLIRDLRDAKEYGSILNVTMVDFPAIYVRIEEIKAEGNIFALMVPDALLPLVKRAEAMAQKYDTVCTNPPYMGANSMSSKLVQYIKDFYPDSKADLYSVFIEKCNSMINENGYQAMITQHSWMFLSSFEKLRVKLNTIDIVNMAHLGARAFEEIGGEVVQTTSFVLSSHRLQNYIGTYCRLINPTSQKGKEQLFLKKESCYYAKQTFFSKIPGSPIAYWVSDRVYEAFSGKLLSDYAVPRVGCQTSDNNRFLRIWSEICIDKFMDNAESAEIAKNSLKKWFPYNKGGSFRRWYGNNDLVINWENDGKEVKDFATSLYKNSTRTVKNVQFYFREEVTWSTLSSGLFSARYCKPGFLFDTKGSAVFFDDQSQVNYCIAYLNSCVSQLFLGILSPTLDYSVGSVGKLPYITSSIYAERINNLVEENINACKKDWDSFETSWDFQHHPLLCGESSLDGAYARWEKETENRFALLKSNEEELNRIFIDIYKLQKELAPEIDDKNVTVRQADREREIRSFISYAVGCMFGRYSLDEDGLAYAGGVWDSRKYATFIPDVDNCIPVTDEPYFEDDIVGRFVEFVRTVYGERNLEDNLNFIANSLRNKGNSSREKIRDYFLNDFFKDHCATYSVSGSGKRPIYWLFDSGKQNGFKALVYMHRWTADTIGNLRVEYLHRMQRVYEKEITRMQDIVDNSRDNREINQAAKRREKLVKQLKEARDYDAKIAHAALSRVEIDLDDGVKVNYEKVQKGSDGKSLGILAKI